jgi:hypothetical protein
MIDVMPAAEQTETRPVAVRVSQVSALALAITVLALSWRWGGASGILHLGVYALALMPGLPVGLALFGRRHAGAWIVGGVLGYGLTAAALWVAVVFRTPLATMVAWSGAMATGLALGRVVRVRVQVTPWRAVDTIALLTVLLLVPALMARPLSRLGEPDDFGRVRYRSYFTADVLWHAGLTPELAQQRWPVRDPFAAPLPLHYYVAYFLVPAVSVASLTGGHDTVLAILRVNALGAGLMLVSAIFLAGWIAVPRAAAIGWATALALIGASAEGAYACWRLASEGRPFNRLRTINVDAITNWWFHSPTIDGLPRALWYTPQHGASCALGALALTLASACGSTASAGVTAVSGMALGLSVVFSPFLGGLFALVFGLAMIVDAVGTRSITGLLRQSLTLVPVGAAIVFTRQAGVLEGAGTALAFDARPLFTTSAVVVMALALGPLLVPAVVGLARVGASRAMMPAVVALAIGTVTFFTVSLAGTDPVWVGWRAGNLLLVTLPTLAAAGFAAAHGLHRRTARMAAITLFAALGAIGSVTTAVDWYNAQDVENEWPGPGFRWTLRISPAQQAAFDWIRHHTPRRAVVQMDPVVRGREGWVNIPAFGQRVMAAGLPISLVQQPYHRERSDRVHRLFMNPDAKAAWAEARAMRIDFLYLDATDSAVLPVAALEKFERPEFFTTAFARDDVRVYAVSR